MASRCVRKRMEMPRFKALRWTPTVLAMLRTWRSSIWKNFHSTFWKFEKKKEILDNNQASQERNSMIDSFLQLNQSTTPRSIPKGKKNKFPPRLRYTGGQ
mmetsp:Transcript_10927/g.26432  ORF Transcript_10927/g.26432 Transcript_10927/m.26432 type:complete len:100 (+) Transcript_10927:1188-1487(+)